MQRPGVGLRRVRFVMYAGDTFEASTGRDNMNDRELLSHITSNPEIFGGKPIIRGMRISVELMLSLLAQGETVEGILADYPDLTRADIQACLAYARAVIANDTLDAVKVG